MIDLIWKKDEIHQNDLSFYWETTVACREHVCINQGKFGKRLPNSWEEFGNWELGKSWEMLGKLRHRRLGFLASSSPVFPLGVGGGGIVHLNLNFKNTDQIPLPLTTKPPKSRAARWKSPLSPLQGGAETLFLGKLNLPKSSIFGCFWGFSKGYPL